MIWDQMPSLAVDPAPKRQVGRRTMLVHAATGLALAALAQVMSVTMGGMLTVPAGIVEAAIPQGQLFAILALPADATAVT